MLMSQGRCISLGLLVLSACLATACTQSSLQTVVLSMQELNCAECGFGAEDEIQTMDGVRSVQFDVPKAELKVEYDARIIDVAALMATIKRLGYPSSIGAGQGSYQKTTEFPGGADVANINQPGEDVNLAEHRAPGKITVFDFYAKWCGPCKKVDEAMAELMQSHAHLAYRRIDIGAWDSPVVKRYMPKVPELPYVIIQDDQGKNIDVIVGLDLPRLRRAVALPAEGEPATP